MPGTNLIHYRECACCGKEFPITDLHNWGWKLDKDYFCTFSCYTKVYNTKHVASRVSSRVSRPSNMPVELERVLRSGRRY